MLAIKKVECHCVTAANELLFLYIGQPLSGATASSPALQNFADSRLQSPKLELWNKASNKAMVISTLVETSNIASMSEMNVFIAFLFLKLRCIAN